MTKLPSFVMNDSFSIPSVSALWNLLYGGEPSLLEQNVSSYPKYNIYKDPVKKNVTHIVLAVAGMKKDNIKLTTLKNKLSISYTKTSESAESDKDTHTFVVQHIADRSWTQTFTASEGYELEVLEAEIEDGLLNITVKTYIPDELKEKEIKIKY